MLRCDLCVLSSFLPNLKGRVNVLMKGQMAVLENKWALHAICPTGLKKDKEDKQ